MSAPTASRARLVGIAGGVLVLLALVLLAVVLPRLGEGAASSSSSSSSSSSAGGEVDAVTLPPSVPGFTSAATADDAAAAQLTERLGSAEDRLEELYDAPAAVALYTGEQGAQDQRSAVVTALAVPDGLFLPGGPAPDPALLDLARNQASLEPVGDALCNLVFQAPVPAGERVDASEVPLSVQCQLNEAGVTYQVDGSAMSAQDAVGILDAVAAAQG